MPQFHLANVKLPDFGVPQVRPELPVRIFENRIHSFQKQATADGMDIIIVYADREHSANMAYLTSFEPRFEEALLVLAPKREPLIITGPENQGYAKVSPIPCSISLYPPFGLLGQDRRSTKSLADFLSTVRRQRS
jgi:hypothetical protein